MGSSRFGIQLLFRVLLLLLSAMILAFLTVSVQLPFTIVFTTLVLILQIVELYRFVNLSNRELQKFLEAVQYGDYAVNFQGSSMGKNFKELNQTFNQLILQLKEAEAEKQSKTELLKLILGHIRLGLIVVDGRGQIELMNAYAQELLNIPQFGKWEMLAKSKPDFAAQLAGFSFEGRKLIALDSVDGQREFFLDLSRINLLGQDFHLIAFSDLKNEIEQKEIEAWHKLIRILAHEVMNSVTPVTSLSETMLAMLQDEEGKPLPSDQLSEDMVEDLSEALETIVRRSRGMLNFVEEYRKLTRLPAPSPEPINLQKFLEEIIKLMQAELKAKGIQISHEVHQKSLSVRADRKMLEQSLINLLGNAAHALEGKSDGQIHLKASYRDNYTELSISDNGKGIEEEILSSIFIPFFSTRKNGSGIGLTLVKSIMRQHKGSVLVESKVGEGTTFKLRFPN